MVVSAAVKILDQKQLKTIIIPCHRHSDAFRILRDFKISFKEKGQGFLDEHGRFLTREEAYTEAIRSGQFISDGSDPRLYSEDLW